jgi:SAM-dependent methyltransferase
MVTKVQYAAGDYDWLDIWRRMYDAERAQAEAIPVDAASVPADRWAYRARRFATASSRVPQPDPYMRALLPFLRPDDCVLDIGAGAGRYVPILAQHVARVIAVEPSPAMRSHLEQRIQDEQLENVEVIADGWPLSSPLPAAVDVALSAHVLYAVREAGPFLQAMHATARRISVLFLMIRHFNTSFSPLWQRFHGEPRLTLPGALEACNVLYQLGYPAALQPVAATSMTCTDLNEAIQDIRPRLRLTSTPQNDADLAAAIQELLVYNDDGSLALPNQPSHAAVVWWETHGND